MEQIVRMAAAMAKVVVVTVVAAALVTACGDDDSNAGAAAVTVSLPTGTTTLSATTAAAGTTTVAATTAAAVTTAASTTTAETTPPPTEAEEVVDAHIIAVTVGTDDATTVGERVESVPLGSEVRLELVAPEDEEYHLHGYDIEQVAPAGQPVVISFTADLAGEFELESHLDGDLLMVLVVE